MIWASASSVLANRRSALAAPRQRYAAAVGTALATQDIAFAYCWICGASMSAPETPPANRPWPRDSAAIACVVRGSVKGSPSVPILCHVLTSVAGCHHLGRTDQTTTLSIAAGAPAPRPYCR
ncbi:Uncharacterised protein [Mycobacterium tuberculosis]|uniref:Uncharacterized protein n=1 Tax=Mycobacterium tuberculosis TaxID=1773 RepID=A0A916P8V4_MYCTX|nr:hypothetical protein MRGA423_24605 [Mycobacterium tuberculosis RGTB423]COX41266.1 Uncharacterised protein [Mycobacterium tuberculosis]COY28736.1 Uncharacterised protein [Mycobacterium tuberculosis]COZ12173.1 Uncharacterised protein [Mycobacterium tuberculosis]